MKKRNQKMYAFSKTISLMIPAIVSICILIFVIFKFILRNEYINLLSHHISENDISVEHISNQLYKLIDNNMYDALGLIIGIIGVAVSVWIGLSIFNAVEKRDFDNLSESFSNTLQEIEKQHRILYLTTMLKQSAEDSSTLSYIEYIQRKLPDYDIETINVIIEMESMLSSYDATYLSAEENELTVEMLKKIKEKYVLLKEQLVQNNIDSILSSYYYYKIGGVNCRIADCLFRMKEKPSLAMQWFNDAIQEYNKAIERDSTFLSVDNGIGYSYLRLAQLNNNDPILGKKAIEHLRLACEKIPNFEKAIRNLGVAYEVCNELDKAIEQYKYAEKLFPGSDLVHSCLASAYLKKIDAKINFFKRSTSFDEKYFSFTALEKDEIYCNLKKAKWHAEYVIKLKPSKIDGYYRLIEYYTFLILISRKHNHQYKKYTYKIHELEKYCNTLDADNHAYKYHLRNYYEVIGNLKKQWK